MLMKTGVVGKRGMMAGTRGRTLLRVLRIGSNRMAGRAVRQGMKWMLHPGPLKTYRLSDKTFGWCYVLIRMCSANNSGGNFAGVTVDLGVSNENNAS